ncbi:MAG: tetratricopeptide repeat protein [Candidatus Electryoneaceae bacterium]|nr:tetratricopeptide repeat protein [Candidatus Electryoneaceae bacterium]
MRTLLISFTFVLLSLSYVHASFQQDYSKAYQTYENANTEAKLKAVAQQFEALTVRSDAGDRRYNALFWLGQCLMKMKRYLKALNTFERIFLIPNSNKDEDARFKVVICYARLGWNDTARWEINRFARDYPNSNSIDDARQAIHP